MPPKGRPRKHPAPPVQTVSATEAATAASIEEDTTFYVQAPMVEGDGKNMPVTAVMRYLEYWSNQVGSPTRSINMSPHIRLVGNDLALWTFVAPALPPGQPLVDMAPYPTAPTHRPCYHCQRMIDTTVPWLHMQRHRGIRPIKEVLAPKVSTPKLMFQFDCAECLLAFTLRNERFPREINEARTTIQMLGGDPCTLPAPFVEDMDTFGGSEPLPPQTSPPHIPPGTFHVGYNVARVTNYELLDAEVRAQQLAAALDPTVVPPAHKCMHCGLDATFGGSEEPLTEPEYPGARWCCQACKYSSLMQWNVGLVKDAAKTGGMFGPMPPRHMLCTFGGPLVVMARQEDRLLMARRPHDIASVFHDPRMVATTVRQYFKGELAHSDTKDHGTDTFAEATARGSKMRIQLQAPEQEQPLPQVEERVPLLAKFLSDGRWQELLDKSNVHNRE
jgi:hypothetical protein